MLMGEVIREGVLRPAIEIDEAGTVIDWNEGAEALFGWTAGEAIGRHLTDLFVPGSEAFALEARMEQLRLGRDWPDEMLFVTKDGEIFSAQIFMRRIDSGDYGFLLHFPDAPGHA
jgi:PAS domain S-box-containing protein